MQGYNAKHFKKAIGYLFQVEQLIKSGFYYGQCSYSGNGRILEKLVIDRLGSSYICKHVCCKNLSVTCQLPRLKGDCGGMQCSGFMARTLAPRLSGLGLSPGQGHFVVFLGKTLYSHSAYVHPGVQMGTGKLIEV